MTWTYDQSSCGTTARCRRAAVAARAPGTAGKGCIIVGGRVRELSWKSGDRELEVVA